MTTQTTLTRDQQIEAAWAQRAAQEKAAKDQAWNKADSELQHQQVRTKASQM